MSGRALRRAALMTAAIVVAAMSWLVTPAVATSPDPDYSSVDQPGPPLSVGQSTLDAALSCSQDLASAKRDVILVIPPTGFDPVEAFGWNYLPAFKKQGWPYCTVTVPDHGNGDIQIAAEYVVNSVRRIHAESHRQVALFGWSQGASTSPRWALRWWPDIRPMVSTLAALAPVNEGGGDVLSAACVAACVPAAWQQFRRLNGDSPHFMDAMNSRQQTFDGIAYTTVYTLLDQVAGLNIGAHPVGPLPPAANVLNVAIQKICPIQPFEHLSIPASSVAYAVLIKALAAPGELPDLGTIDKTQVCANPLMPFVNPVTLATNATKLTLLLRRALVGMVPAEPPLKCYVIDKCPSTEIEGGGE